MDVAGCIVDRLEFVAFIVVFIVGGLVFRILLRNCMERELRQRQRGPPPPLPRRDEELGGGGQAPAGVMSGRPAPPVTSSADDDVRLGAAQTPKAVGVAAAS
ncbi:hypothetical protein U9M48_034520 [Paspalum notatum var. saurae]|uniref:Uncharacterized protein n=1 Tax=Paspalum notatum var. saurae TaxID=547442 RepID=A0AAQ3UDP4_PASNO